MKNCRRIWQKVNLRNESFKIFLCITENPENQVNVQGNKNN